MVRARQGDTGAFAALVQRHRAVALRVAHAVGGREAEDVVQEAFVKAYRNLHRFRDGAPFRPWMLRIVANEASNARRSAGRRASLALRVSASTGAAAEGMSAEDAVVASERREALAAALASLPEHDRMVLTYRWFAELSEAEMATALGCRPGTVKSRLSRAHGRLRDALAEGAPSDG